jgi:hypothetical protein
VRELSRGGRLARAWLWRLDVLDGDVWLVGEAHGELGAPGSLASPRRAFSSRGVGTRQYFGSKVRTYHWDDQVGEDGRVLGHGPGNSDGDFPHLQIHALEGPIARIFWSP